MFYGYYELQGHFEQMAKTARGLSDEEVRKRLTYWINKLEIPVEPRQLKIRRGYSDMEISLNYQEIFYIPLGEKDLDLHTFHFRAHAKEQYAN